MLNAPGAHAPHADAPGSGAYAPEAHEVHTADVRAAATPPYAPAAQLVQAEAPVKLE